MCATTTAAAKTVHGDKPHETTATPKRVVFPNAHERADQRTLKAWFYRHILFIILYGTWVCGVAFFSGMNILTIFSFIQTAMSRGETPIPIYIQMYIGGLVLYYSYHYVMFRHKPQGVWTKMRIFARRVMVDYRYFQHHICIFEEREQESLQHPEKPMVAKKEKAMFAYHPHGALSSGLGLNGVHSYRFVETDARWLVAENLFWFPVLRDILRWLEFDDISRQTFVKHMQQDRTVCLYPGGFEEATIYRRGRHRVFIKNRGGFIKLALQHGYKVHPVYTFGEEQTYHAMHHFLKQRMLLNKWKVPALVFYGCFWCFVMPRQSLELTTVVGKPIQMPTIAHPTRDDVAKYHQIYMDELVALFDRNKHKYAEDPSIPLELY